MLREMLEMSEPDVTGRAGLRSGGPAVVSRRCRPGRSVRAISANAQCALDTIRQKPVKGIPSWLLHVMELRHIERLAGAAPGAYRRDPDGVYLAFQRAIGTCLLDQYLADNPLTMGDQGFEGTRPGATTGAEEIVLDGVPIDSPEAVVEHLERVVFPGLRRAIRTFDEAARRRRDHGARARSRPCSVPTC